MIAYNFHSKAGSEAGSAAIAGRGKLQLRHGGATTPADPSYRATSASLSEQRLIAYLSGSIGPHVSPLLVTDLYISLKTSPLVVLVGEEGRGKVALVQSFANALLGSDSPQLVVITGGNWTDGTGQRNYYRTLHERFGSVRFQEALHDAAQPANRGKFYLVFLQALTSAELHDYFERVLPFATGGRRLYVGEATSAEQAVVLPPNLAIVATLNVPYASEVLDQAPLSEAGLIVFDDQLLPVRATSPALPPPVGYQRMMIEATLRDPAQAYERLNQILGRRAVRDLHPSTTLMQVIWRHGVCISPPTRQEILVYVAGSFDADGNGLFDPSDPLRNAQMAFDLQVMQRVLRRLRVPEERTTAADPLVYMPAGLWCA